MSGAILLVGGNWGGGSRKLCVGLKRWPTGPYIGVPPRKKCGLPIFGQAAGAKRLCKPAYYLAALPLAALRAAMACAAGLPFAGRSPQ